MVRTVPRKSVAKWPDSGATRRTRGCGVSTSFLKCKSVPNGVVSAACSWIATSRLPTVTPSIPKAGPAWVSPCARNELVGRGQVAQNGVVGNAGQRPAERSQGGTRPVANRNHDVGMGLIGLVEHCPPGGGARSAARQTLALPLTRKGSAFY